MMIVSPRWLHIMLAMLIVVCGVQIIAAQERLYLEQHPRVWGLPAVLEARVEFVSPQTWSQIAFDLEVTREGLNVAIDETQLHECLYQVNGAGSLKPFDPTPTSRYAISGHEQLGGDTTLESFRLVCHGFTLQRPSGVTTSEPITLDVKMQMTGAAGMSHLQSTVSNIEVMDRPTLTTDYRWTLSGTVVATFIFSRPASLNNEMEFSIDHPLLNISDVIDKMRLPPGTDPLAYLGVPYHLQTEIRDNDRNCRSTGQQAAVPIEYRVDSVIDRTTAWLLFPDSTPINNMPFQCTFEREYPADVISYLLSEENPLANPTVSIRYGNNPTYTYSIQPPTVIPYPTSPSSPPRNVFLWVAPHHHRDGVREFEFGIATSAHTLTTGGIQDGTAPQNSLTFWIANGIKLLSEATPLAQWSPSMDCRDHYASEYPTDSGNSNENGNVERSYLINGFFVVANGQFGGLGKTCRLRLGAQSTNAIRRSFFVQYHDIAAELTLFTGMHTTAEVVNQFVLHDTSSIVAAQLPSLTPPHVPLLKTIDPDGGAAVGSATINVQYLLPGVIPLDKAGLVLSMLFTQRDDFPVAVGMTVGCTLSIGNRIIGTISGIQFTSNIHHYLKDDSEMDPNPVISHVFQPGQPIRALKLTIPITPSIILLTTSKPFTITIHFRTPGPNDLTETAFFPVLSSEFDTKIDKYMPEFALITPVRDTPLTGYSYRCVTWDHVVAPYVYDVVSAPLPLTPDNSYPCPSYLSAETGKVDVTDRSMWRRTESMTDDDSSQCFYELAAVCVTPSTTVEGAYDIHPLADCPSTLGAVHAVPCSLVDEQVWNYSLSQYQPTISPPEQHAEDDLVLEKRSMTLRWTYSGDPRLTLTAAIKPVVEGSDTNGEHEPEGWITLARDIPANLSPQPDQRGLTIGFPILGLQVTHVLVRLSLNEIPDIYLYHTVKVAHTTPEQSGPGALDTGCDPNMDKVFDDVTYLCRCKDGFVASGPTSVENPLVHPIEFTCSSACNDSERYQWDADTGRCVDEEGNVECDNHGVWSPSFQRCVCMTGYYGQYCQYDDTTDPTLVCEELQCVADHTMKGDVTGEDVISNGECEIDNDVDNDSSSVVCNCADGFTGDQCQHQAVCGVRQCVNGRLVSPTGKPEECKCECNNDYITGSTCNQCTLACRNGGVANTRCTACQCPAGYIGTTCTIPVWYHTFTLRNLPQHIVELILGTTASDKEAMAILQQTMVKYLLEDYSRVLSETFIVVDGNGNGDQDDNDTRIRVRVELSQFQTVIPPANPNAPYVHIQLMLYPADMTEEMLAYALQHGLDFDWSRVTDNLEFFRKFLREQGVTDDIVPDIDDPGCTTRECRENIIEEESSNHASITFTPLLAMALPMCLATMILVLTA